MKAGEGGGETPSVFTPFSLKEKKKEGRGGGR